MNRALIAALICVVVLSPLPLMARGGGGHGGGGHCGGAHGGHGVSHGGSFGGGFRHGCAFSHCGFAHFGGGGYWGDYSYWGDYLDRVSPTPGRDNGASEALDAGEPDEAAPRGPLSAQEEAQYRYDHRSGGD